MNNLILRGLTGAVYIAVIVCGLLLPWPAPLILVLVLGIPAAVEYGQLFASLRRPTGWMWGDVLAIAVTILLFTGFTPQVRGMFDDWNPWVWTSGVFVPFYIMVRFLTAIFIPDGRTALLSLGRGVCGIFYIGVPLGLLGFLAAMEPVAMLLMFIMIWANDTGAFLVGSRIGRRRLCERLSPKKSWEGFWGGLILCAIVGLIYALCWRQGCQHPLRFITYGVLGLVVSVAATLGDLFESMLKRVAGVKDAGRLLPGHGGMLDRIDSLLFVAPVTFVVLIFFTHI